MRASLLNPFKLRESETFLLSAWVSNIGSQTLLLSFPVFGLATSLSISEIGMLLAVVRISQTASVFLIGEKGDQFDPRKVLFWTELFGAATSAILLWFAARRVIPGPDILAIIFAIRGMAIGMQPPLRSRIGKALTSFECTKARSMAVRLNVVSQGSTLFSALALLLFSRSSGFVGVCIADLLSFFLSAASVNRLSTSCTKRAIKTETKGFQLVRTGLQYYRSHQQLLLTELLIHLPVWGTQTLFVRFVGDRTDLMPFCWIMYGASVLVSAGFTKFFESRSRTPLWILQFVGFLLAALFYQKFWLSLASLGLVYISYFSYWHLVSQDFQLSVSEDDFTAIASIRSLIATLVISSGDLFVGLCANSFALTIEYSYRALLTAIVGLSLTCICIRRFCLWRW